MADENPVECARLHSAYVEMRREMSQAHFAALMEAFESDVRDGAFAYLPVADGNVEAVRGGHVKWLVLPTPKGNMLALFTSKEEAARHPSGNLVGVRLAAFVRAAMEIKECVGILVNPFDGHRGVPVERRNLEILVRRAGGQRPPQLYPGVVSNAVYHLWDIAVGIPTAVYDVSKEIEALGGLEKILKPILDGWSERARANPQEFPETSAHDLAFQTMGQFGMPSEIYNQLVQELFKKFQELHEPYWTAKEPRDYTLAAFYAAFMTGCSVSIERFEAKRAELAAKKPT